MGPPWQSGRAGHSRAQRFRVGLLLNLGDTGQRGHLQLKRDSVVFNDGPPPVPGARMRCIRNSARTKTRTPAHPGDGVQAPAHADAFTLACAYCLTAWQTLPGPLLRLVPGRPAVCEPQRNHANE